MLTDLVEISQVMTVTHLCEPDHTSLGALGPDPKPTIRTKTHDAEEPVAMRQSSFGAGVTSLAVAYDFRFESRTARLPPSNCAAEYRRRSGEDLKEDLDQAFRRNDRP